MTRILYPARVEPVPLLAPTADRWLLPLAEPRRDRPGLGAAQSGGCFFAGAPIAPAESVGADSWLVAFAEPQRTRPALPAALQAHGRLGAAAPFAETVSADRWLLPLGEPVRGRPGLGAALRPQPAAPVAPIASAPSVAIDSWFAALAEPIRIKLTRPAVPLCDQAASPFVEPTTVDRWQRPLAEPRRLAAGLPAHWQRDLAFVQAPPFAEAVSLDRWLLAWSDPPRLRHCSAAPHGLPPAWLVQVVDIPSGTAIPRSGGAVTYGGGSAGVADARAAGTPAVPR